MKKNRKNVKTKQKTGKETTKGGWNRIHFYPPLDC